MRTAQICGAAALVGSAMAARPFLNEPDTGIELALGDLPVGELPDLETMVGLPDFDYAARNYLPAENYTYYRNGASGEWTYRDNLEIYSQFKFRPRVMVDITQIESSLPTTLLGSNFSAPFFISPCARAGLGHPDAEINFVKAAASENILYIPSQYASKSMEEIAEAKEEGQVIWQQVYITNNDTANAELIKRIEKNGAKAIVFTADSAAGSIRQRAARFGVGSANTEYVSFTWDLYHQLANMTDLPIIVKGISTYEDAVLAVENKVPAIILSNHGGRQLDSTQTSLETALEIHNEAPDVFKQIEVYADGGVRYGTDALKLLALGVRAVGMGRPFMLANVFGVEGVQKVVSIMKNEIAVNAGNLGLGDLKDITANAVKWAPSGISR
ncbi:FMN-dependent dehydrogenase domain-containing protein [Sarocladium implicatum]|nr:FMN-dependent dehydrogenase domain-containing protein [Sarocladium implicatum]